MKINNLTLNEEKLTGYASVDKPWMKYYPEDAKKIEIPKKTIYRLLKDSSEKRLKDVALDYFGVKISYEQYLKKIEKLAGSLAAFGVKKDEMVIISFPNVPESRELIYAINYIGAVSYPVSPMLPPLELEKIIKNNKIKKVFMFNQFYPKYKEILEKFPDIEIVMSDGKESIPSLIKSILRIKEKMLLTGAKISKKNNIITFEKFKKMQELPIEADYEPNKVACVIGTSGTTGVQKGVCLTDDGLNASAFSHMYGDMNFDEGDILLDLLIQSIGYGISVAHYSGVCGLHTILYPKLETHIYNLIKKYKPSHFTGGPIHYENLLQDMSENNEELPLVKNMVSGGAPLSEEVERKLNKCTNGFVEKKDSKNVFVRQGLGCTENGGAATYAKKTAYKFGGVGIPLLFENMSIFEPGTDHELKYNEVGEICISGPMVMKEYLNNPEETEKVLKIHSDGTKWVHTGDLGKVDEDGQFYIIGRIKNMFARKGFNVHPNTIANYIMTLNGVKGCEVIGIDHPYEQKVPVAFIERSSNIDEESLKKFILDQCALNLEETSIPYDIIFVDELPRNLGGKVDPKRLLEITNVDFSNENENMGYRLLKRS